MTQQQRFFRKIIYVVIIAVLIIPLYLMGNPAQRSKSGVITKGGMLAQIRNENGLAEVNLGEIDPASSTMKLATFGMRGVAIALLWNRSLEYEKRADWNNVVVTGNQIIMLEPHFITIWDFVGWKLAYNASAQFDDYRERYRWVIRGFDFLQKGTSYNQTDPRLFSKAGWTISQKIGIADEKDQYRRLFREDEEFHARQVYKERDNWLFGRNYYQVAEDLYERGGSIGKETRMIFYSRSRMNLIHYAEWMELDGCGTNKTNSPVFDEEHAAAAWKTAEEHWKDFCKMVIKTTIEDKKNPGEYRKTSLNLYHEVKAEIEQEMQNLEKMLPEGVDRDTIAWDRWNNELTDQQRASLLPKLLDPADETDYNLGEVDRPYRVIRSFLDGERGPQPGWENWRERLEADRQNFYPDDLKEVAAIPAALRDETDSLKLRTTEMKISEWAAQAYTLINVTPEMIADHIEGDDALTARDICDTIVTLKEEVRFSGMFRDIMDCNRHDRKVVVEQQEEARHGRDLRSQVRVKYQAAQHEEANQAFLDSMASWKKLMDKPGFEDIRRMPQFVSEFTNEVSKYVIVLDQLERIFPDVFPFQEIIRDGQSAKYFNLSMDEAIPFVEKKLANSEFAAARDYSERLLRSGEGLTAGDEVMKLGPLPEIREKIFTVARLYVQAWEGLGEAAIAEARTAGTFENYPARNFIELMIAKGDATYQEVGKVEVLLATDPDNASDHLAKAVTLWKELLDRYPILKYDRASEFRPQIAAVAGAYVTDLKKNEQDVPEDFALKSFLD
ncbi:MAG: hypothetical protein Q4G68_02965 [Planctomycetia bacterium]|nr:hypothetical protein [Planctomycetia bacterium]